VQPGERRNTEGKPVSSLILPPDRQPNEATRHPTARKEVIEMNLLRNRHIVAILLLAALAGCTQQQQSPQAIREKTAQATAEVKSDAKAVADGLREGWDRNKPLDLNTASREQLHSLPGMTEGEADRVIAGRPYDEPTDLVKRHILPKEEYDKIADQVTAKK
jgi:DNA uptake protein ComE-like DNA-binding protein